jgi:hypothetical protein
LPFQGSGGFFILVFKFTTGYFNSLTLIFITMINLKYVQELIEKKSALIEIREYFDTKDIVIVFWKHKIYDMDDERGHIIGSGPVVYDKATKEYRVLGSREWFDEDICQLFETDETKEKIKDHEYLMDLFENNEENPSHYIY